MSRNEGQMIFGLLALGVFVVLAARSRGPIVEVIPSNEPLRAPARLQVDEGWRVDQ
jgi:hypothetical protein